VGWLWFLGVLVPVIGLVQVGSQSIADRFTYLPFIGLYVAIAWGAVELVRLPSRLLSMPAALVLAALFVVSWRQVGRWKDTVTVLEHSVAVTKDNYLAHQNLGVYYDRHGGDLAAAIAHFREALRILPHRREAMTDLAYALEKNGQQEEALTLFLRAYPDHVEARLALAEFLVVAGRVPEAESLLREALRGSPRNPGVQAALGTLLLAQERKDEAQEAFLEALRLQPTNFEALFQLGTMRRKQGWIEEAVELLEQAVQVQPQHPEAHLRLALAYWDAGDRAGALRESEILSRLDPARAKQLEAVLE
jgi:tetratricopeptide (TPR) repeat protein